MFGVGGHDADSGEFDHDFSYSHDFDGHIDHDFDHSHDFDGHIDHDGAHHLSGVRILQSEAWSQCLRLAAGLELQ